jgi:hypothetical protein
MVGGSDVRRTGGRGQRQSRDERDGDKASGEDGFHRRASSVDFQNHQTAPADAAGAV